MSSVVASVVMLSACDTSVAVDAGPGSGFDAPPWRRDAGADCGMPVPPGPDEIGCGQEPCGAGEACCWSALSTGCFEARCIPRGSDCSGCAGVRECFVTTPGICGPGFGCCAVSPTLAGICTLLTAPCEHWVCLPGSGPPCPAGRTCEPLDDEGLLGCVVSDAGVDAGG